jgi:hypothetical protein
MRIIRFITLIVMACTAACHATSQSSYGGESASSHEPLATLERTACFGFCPIYKVTIFRDGVVEYEGKQFVKIRGRAIRRLSARQLAQLRELFRRNDYLRLASAYDRLDATDLPWAYTSYSPVPGQTKSIRHYLGDRSASPALSRVEEGIDRLVEIEQWIGTPEERRNLPGT